MGSDWSAVPDTAVPTVPPLGRSLVRMPTEIGADEVQRLVREEDAVVFDVLPGKEFSDEHLPGARNIPLKELTADAVAALDRGRPVIAYCHDDT
jgi:rhodanese-related sulfurtransferase